MRLRDSTARRPGRRLLVGLLAALLGSLSLVVVGASPAQAVPSLYKCLEKDGKLPTLPAGSFVTGILVKTPFEGIGGCANSDQFGNDQIRFITQPSPVEICPQLTSEATGGLTPPTGWRFGQNYPSIICDPGHRLFPGFNATTLVCEGACPPLTFPDLAFVGNAASWGASQDLDIGKFQPGIAVDSAGVIYGNNLTSSNEPARTPIDPQQGCVTSLAGREVRITSYNRHQRDYPACLMYVSKTQINFYLPDFPIPLEFHKGEDAIIKLWDSGGNAAIALTPKPDPCPPPPRDCAPEYEKKVPLRGLHAGLYSATSNGRGAPSAYVVREHEGVQSIEPFNGTVTMGPDGDRVYLILYGTGIRRVSQRFPVNVYLGGFFDGRRYGTTYPARVVQASYAGPAPGLDKAGTDQINVELPRDVASTADTNNGNVVYIRILISDPTDAPGWGQWSNVLGFTVA
jgi:hypothetical protein